VLWKKISLISPNEVHKAARWRIGVITPYYSKGEIARRLGYSDYYSFKVVKTLSLKAIWTLDELEAEVREKSLEPRETYV